MSLSAADPPDSAIREAQSQRIAVLERENARLRERVAQLQRQQQHHKDDLSLPAAEKTTDVGAIGSVVLASKAQVDEWMAGAAFRLKKDPSSLCLGQCLASNQVDGPSGVYLAMVLRAALTGERLSLDALLSGACGAGELAVLVWLVEHSGADDVSRADAEGDTLLHRACHGGHLAVAHWLVQHGAVEDVRRANGRGWTPLHSACFGGSIAVVQWLVQHGAADDVSKADVSGFTPLHWACEGGHLDVVQWLVQHGAAEDVSRLDSAGFIHLHWACCNGHLDVVQWLVQHGAAGDVSRANVVGFTPLHFACVGGNVALVEWLVQHGAADDVSRVDNTGSTPFHLACCGGQLAVVQWLVRHMATMDLASPTNFDETPLSLALKRRPPHLQLAYWLMLVGGPDLFDNDQVQLRLEDPTMRQPLLALIRDALALHVALKLALFGMAPRSGTSHLSKLGSEAGLRKLVSEFVGAVGCQGAEKLRSVLVELEEEEDDHCDFQRPSFSTRASKPSLLADEKKPASVFMATSSGDNKSGESKQV